MKSESLLVVVTDPVDLPGAPFPVVDAATYLRGGATVARPGLRVVNLCRSTAYLTSGYYVGLLADARGQTVIPTVDTDGALRSPQARFRALREAGVELIEPEEVAERLGQSPESLVGDRILPPVKTVTRDGFAFRAPAEDEVARVLVCLGQTDESGFQRIANRIYRAWTLPLLRVAAVREDDVWKVFDVRAESVDNLTEAERAELIEAISARRVRPDDRERRRVPSIAILYDASENPSPSTEETLDRMEKVAVARGLVLTRIGPSALHRLGEHDALFIRTFTGPDRPAFTFATQAEAMGMPVIDDTRSIIRCTNKIFLHELFDRAGIPTPKTRVIHTGTTYAELVEALGLPFVVKLPDGAFSAAVFKIPDEETFVRHTTNLLARSPLLVAQAFVRTDFDWRVTVLGGKVLFTCKYHMVKGHWQIRSLTPKGARYGRVEAVARAKAPRDVVKLACRAAELVGQGLYGVDLKVGPDGPVVIEINDNPNIDTGYDDAADGDAVYEDLFAWFQKRIRAGRAAAQEPDDETEDRNPLREPIGPMPRRTPGREYAAYEVCGLELEYPIVDRDLNVRSDAEWLLATFAGHPTSDVDLGLLGLSNEIFDHVIELKNAVPVTSLARAEEVLVEGVRRVSAALATRSRSRLLPGGMHPWLDPRKARLWRRSNGRIYGTYARLFDVKTHGWANVQACHVNLPLGTPEEAVGMMNAAALLVPYLPALGASSPMYDGELQDAVDNRLAFIIGHQSRLPESSGRIVPEPISSLSWYKREILGKMYKALDALPDSDAIRHEFLNARGAVFKFSRDSLEVRVLDVQECVHMDVALAVFTRRALRWLSREWAAGRVALPDHALLVADFESVVHAGTRARVRAPHLAPDAARAADGTIEARVALRWLLDEVGNRASREEQPYLDRIADILTHGNLSERVAAHLSPLVDDDAGFTEAARRVYIELSECLVENRPWPGRVG